MALADMTSDDLSIPEKVDAVVATAVEVTEQKKEIVEQDTKVKDELKRLCADKMEERASSITLYNFELGQKLTLIPRGGGINVDDNEVLESLYKHFEEEPGNVNGLAWKVWCSITNPPIEPKRTLDQDKLLDVMKAEKYLVPIVQDATSDVAPTYAATCKAMSKKEISAHSKGELSDNFIVS